MFFTSVSPLEILLSYVPLLSRKYILKLISIKTIFCKILDQKENYRDFHNFIELFNTPKN
jgi:hypothetical protein